MNGQFLWTADYLPAWKLSIAEEFRVRPAYGPDSLFSFGTSHSGEILKGQSRAEELAKSITERAGTPEDVSTESWRRLRLLPDCRSQVRGFRSSSGWSTGR